MQKYYLMICVYLPENTEQNKAGQKKLNKVQASI